MNYLSIEEIKKLDKNIHLNETLKNAEEYNNKYNLFVTINNLVKTNNIESLISNVPYAVKDNIVTKDILTTASSKTLENYIPIFNATVIEKLNDFGALNIGKTTMDELGMGGYGLSSHTGIVRNPHNIDHSPGGSSSGSAVSVASGLVSFALGSDTGDSIRKPASYCGIVGYKPTYGLISRYGLIPFASSLDTIGVFTNNVYDAALVVNHIKGLDEKDMTTFESEHIDLIKNVKNNVKTKKMYYFKELLNIENYSKPSNNLSKTLDIFKKNIELLKDNGYLIEELSFDIELFKAIKPVYDVISNAEATTNNSNLTGIIFGPRDDANDINEMIFNYRTNNFGVDVKKRFVLGSFVLQKENQKKYYNNACRIRNIIVMKIRELFESYDALIMPAASLTAPNIIDIEGLDDDLEVALDNNLVIGNFGGFPSITIPMGLIDNMPIGINLTTDIMTDDKLLNIAYDIENILKEGI